MAPRAGLPPSRTLGAGASAGRLLVLPGIGLSAFGGRLAPRAGLEPAALRLTAARSTIELPGKVCSSAPIIGRLKRGSRSNRGNHATASYNRKMSFAPALQFLSDWVRPRAGALDQNLDALREAIGEMGRRGLLGLRVPRDFGGLDFTALDFRRFQEASARASGALAFLESQHQSACSIIARSTNEPLRTR